MAEEFSRKYSKPVIRKKQEELRQRFSNMLTRFGSAMRAHNSVRSIMEANVKEGNKILRKAENAKRKLNFDEKKSLKAFVLTDEDKTEIEHSYKTFKSMTPDYENFMNDAQDFIDNSPVVDLNMAIGIKDLQAAMNQNSHPIALLYHGIHPTGMEFDHKDQAHLLENLQTAKPVTKLPSSKTGIVTKSELDEMEFNVTLENPGLAKDLVEVKKKILQKRKKK